MTKKTGSPVVAIGGVIAVGAVFLLGVNTLGRVTDDRKTVIFQCAMGDGYSWAGGGKALYVIGGKSLPAAIGARPKNDHKVNTWKVVKKVASGNAVALSCIPDWVGVPVKATVSGPGVTPGSGSAIGRNAAVATTYVN